MMTPTAPFWYERLRRQEREVQRAAFLIHKHVVLLEPHVQNLTHQVPAKSGSPHSAAPGLQEIPTMSLGHLQVGARRDYHLVLRLPNIDQDYVAVDGFLEPLDPVLAVAGHSPVRDEEYELVLLLDCLRKYSLHPARLYEMVTMLLRRLVKQVGWHQEPRNLRLPASLAKTGAAWRSASSDHETLLMQEPSFKQIKAMLFDPNLLVV